MEKEKSKTGNLLERFLNRNKNKEIIIGIGIAVTVIVISWGAVEIATERETREIKLYYYNEKRDREIAEYIPCDPEAVLPVSRKIFLSQTPIQDTINLLLQGQVTQEEKEAGFSPMFPLEGIKLIGANLKDGVLTLEFEDLLNKTGGGSCRVRLLWAEVEKTAKQFPEVREVRFLPEELFQP